MLKVKFNSDTGKFDLYKEFIENNEKKEVFKESLTHEEINEKIKEYSTQIFNITDIINTLYLAIQKYPYTEVRK
ncbi:hypothetical protein Arnit_1549 [Arcobacter nitrofigilis DSM 7299]|uniref:Uncharacterized protein n=1 Tax=Arcobacter nitrofigilis (strain ATCC 33309 / DSM 7299 / CCUG 15893 / LMG 7604 / NCTC 12251 / CI) TaxID=572480 RepID=D5V637_ARCNC|nr:hypothetical protein [Arcobacter nitrofigilis]ADG93204.1 hypothetical protein Arnit_1549 [Arcobacter nitrofigilis DSM 7299]